jgi:hypothetical protein
LLLVAITFALVSNFGSGKAAETGKAAQLVTKDAGSTAAPTMPISEQAILAPDNSEIIRTTDANGVRTETRTFNGHPRISKVVVTTSSGKQTARLFTINGDERELPEYTIPTALEASGDELATAAGIIDEKMKSAPGAKVASRKASPSVKAPSQKTVPDTNVVYPNNQAQNAVIPQKQSQSRAAGIENVIQQNQTAEGAKKSATKPR